MGLFIWALQRHAGSQQQRGESLVLAHLTSDKTGATAITPVTKESFPAWLGSVSDPERVWLQATGFTGEPGKFAFVPGPGGKPSRVVVGTPLDDKLWSFAGLPDALPEGHYAIDTALDASSATKAAPGLALG